MRIILAAAALTLTTVVNAQGSFSDEDIRRSLQVDTTTLSNTRSRTPTGGLIAPTAFGMDRNTAFLGLSGAILDGDVSNEDLDGSLSFGIGLGDAARLTGVEISANIISLTDGVGEDGTIGVKWHGEVSPEMRVAVGFTNLAQWGAAKDIDNTLYAVLTRALVVGSRAAAVSVGAGSGRFADFGNPSSDSSLSGFLSANLQLTGNTSLMAGLGRNAIGAGITLAVPQTPVVATFGLTRTEFGDNESAVTGIFSLGMTRPF